MGEGMGRLRAARPPSWRLLVTVLLQFVAVSFLTLVFSLLFWSHAPQLIGWQPRVVLTGSMEPVIQPGDVAVIGPAVAGSTTLPKGRVVLVRDPEMPSGFYLHRVVRYQPDGALITKGDANATVDTDPVSPDQVTGQLRLVVPLVGRPVVWMRTGHYVPVVVLALATWLALVVAMDRRPGPPPVLPPGTVLRST